MNVELRWRGGGFGAALVHAVAQQLGTAPETVAGDVVVRGDWPEHAWLGTDLLSAQVCDEGVRVRASGFGWIAVLGAMARVPFAPGVGPAVTFLAPDLELDLGVGTLAIRTGRSGG